MPETPAVIPALAAEQEEMTAWRRDIHAHPELGFEEHRTSALVAEKLRSWGLEVTTGVGRTGVVGTLRVGNSTRAIGLRADMDALPIPEANGFAHRSTSPGVMHACGHDGHTTMLLGAARHLSRTRDFEGCVHFIFQPAEEGIGGAQAMLADGLFEKFPCESVYGMHNRPGLAVGKFSSRPGAMMAGGALFDITVHGKGAHGGRPQSGIDPVMVAAHIATAAQTIVSRNADPREVAVLSITAITCAESYNVIPHTAHMKGTARTFSTPTMELIRDNLARVATGVAAAMGAEAEVDFRIVFAPLVNAGDEFRAACAAAALVVGDERVDRNGDTISASDDFSFMMNVVPGAYVIIGQGVADRPGSDWHHPGYDFNDEILPLGASYWVNLVETRLAPDR